MQNRLQLLGARPSLYMISDNPNKSLGIVDCSLYNRRIALKNDYHQKRKDHTLKVHFVMNNLISDKLDYSEQVNEF